MARNTGGKRSDRWHVGEVFDMLDGRWIPGMAVSSPVRCDLCSVPVE